MKKLSLITVLDNINLGTYLQVLALTKVLESKNLKVEVVNYIRPFLTLKGRYKSILKEGVLRLFYEAFLRIPFECILRKKYYKFLCQYIKLSEKEYSSYKDLEKCPPLADIYVTGSDQVWNSEHNQGIDRSYYLAFAPETALKMSYGASIGMEDFPDNEKAITIQLLKRYNKISVRESSAKLLLENYGFNDIKLVLDPTLLLDKNQWSSFVVEKKFKKKEPYVLLYTVEKTKQNKIINNMAKKIAKERNLKIYGVSSCNYIAAKKQLYCCDKIFSAATPDVFVSLMLNADFVIVSSFHGTAFSVNFNKQFITITPAKFNTRIDSLLSICDLKNRIVTYAHFDTTKLADIDYNVINDNLDKHREDSMKFIEEILINNNLY
jgi:hypothetical protein